MNTKQREALDLLQRALCLMDEQDMSLVATRIATAIDDLLRTMQSQSARTH